MWVAAIYMSRRYEKGMALINKAEPTLSELEQAVAELEKVFNIDPDYKDVKQLLATTRDRLALEKARRIYYNK